MKDRWDSLLSSSLVCYRQTCVIWAQHEEGFVYELSLQSVSPAEPGWWEEAGKGTTA